MLTEDIQQLITDTVAEVMPEAFIVSLHLARGPQSVLDVKVDTDAGITMEECAALSRKIGHALENREDFDFPYTLEVSSPGVGTPLVMHRQYVKNVGRHLQVRLSDGQIRTGLLQQVTDETFTLELLPDKKRKGKKKAKPNQSAENEEDPTQTIPLGEVEEAKVVIIF